MAVTPSPLWRAGGKNRVAPKSNKSSGGNIDVRLNFDHWGVRRSAARFGGEQSTSAKRLEDAFSTSKLRNTK